MHVDRVEQLAQAERLINAGSAHRALFFAGEEGIGKTALLIEVHRRHSDSTVCYVDLGTTWTMLDVLNAISRQADEQGVRMDAFRALKQRYAVPSVDLRNLSMNRSHLDLALHVNADRETQTSALCDEVVARLAESASADGSGPIVVLDAFDRCEPPMQSWLSGGLVPDLLATRRITVLLAGRSVPTLSHPYSGVVQNLILPPFDTATVREWIELADVEDLKDAAEELHAHSGGLPSAIAEFLSHFKREN